MTDQKTVTLTCDCGEKMTVVLNARKRENGTQGCVVGIYDVSATRHTCKPPLPTEPGIYRDGNGNPSELLPSPDDVECPWRINGYRMTPEEAAAFAPFTRVRTLADDEVAVKIDAADGDTVRFWLGLKALTSPSCRYMARIAQAAKAAGLLDGGDDA